MSYILYNSCCFETFPNLKDNSIDLVLCDPPYNVTGCKWDIALDHELMWKHIFRVIKKNRPVLIFCMQPYSSYLIMSNISRFKFSLVLEKSRGSGFAQAKNKPISSHEEIAVFSEGVNVHASQSKNRMPYFPQGLKRINAKVNNSTRRCDKSENTSFNNRPSHSSEYFQEYTNYPRSVIKMKSENSKFHPTQKPIAMLEYIIRSYSKEGDTILDFTMGSGSTGVACVNTNRNFIGIERDKNYFNIASKRIEDAEWDNGI
jgi:site-specific DNA-methyltransferase (adenine-specific)